MLSGALIIDKPKGLTSHDVVRKTRRALGMRKVGHAGTLDPMATGVLVVLVGEGTKLVPFLTADDKRYRAGVSFGRSTDTLDAEGETTAEAPLPAWWPDRDRIEAALAQERARTSQAPPIYSAIKIGGKSAHARVRAGEQVELAPRPVRVRELSLASEPSEHGTIDLSLNVSKGYYVRSLARDIGQTLEVPAHLCALRRESSGVFTLEEAIPAEEIAPERLMRVAAAATRAMPSAVMTSEGATRARCGAKLSDDDFVAPPPEGRAAWLDGDGELVAVGEREADTVKVVRVFNLNG